MPGPNLSYYDRIPKSILESLRTKSKWGEGVVVSPSHYTTCHQGRGVDEDSDTIP
jgi:hypothetical protein